MDRALLVGINQYGPGFPNLQGCVNDVQDMAQYIVERRGFAAESIRVLTDSRATTQEILSHLIWLTDGAKGGDRLLFHYSGHGAQFVERDAAGGIANDHEDVICPTDFAWDYGHMITSSQFESLFSQIPAGTDFCWISDSCHSGDINDAADDGRDITQSRRVRTPFDIAWRLVTARSLKREEQQFIHVAGRLNAVLVAGCRSDQTSADAVFNGRSNGAMTYFLLKALKQRDGTLREAVQDVHKELDRAGYQQEPQLIGPVDLIDGPFLV